MRTLYAASLNSAHPSYDSTLRSDRAQADCTKFEACPKEKKNQELHIQQREQVHTSPSRYVNPQKHFCKRKPRRVGVRHAWSIQIEGNGIIRNDPSKRSYSRGPDQARSSPSVIGDTGMWRKTPADLVRPRQCQRLISSSRKLVRLSTSYHVNGCMTQGSNGRSTGQG